MLKVFLGSTFKDLHEHRAAVQVTINRRDDCKAVVMEEFGARVGRPKAVCLEIAGDCDLYVGLIGHCYGHVPDGESMSITEAEYEAAVEKGLPRLLFLANDGFTPPAHFRESDGQHRKLQEFRARLQRDETCQWFDNDKGTLAARVGEALSRELAKLPKRADEPAAMPVFLPKRGLCVGRDAEVAQVCRAVLAEEPEPVVVLGPPGIGKSKVTIATLHDPEVKVRFSARRWFVRLETAPEPAAILGQVALAAGVAPGPDLTARLLAKLADGPGLLVLDNTETPWWRDAVATEAVLTELTQVPELALVCSVRGHRAPGRPRFGTTVLVPGLPEAEARELFLARAGERHRHSALLPGLLTTMDGVPLAIELLATQVRTDETSLARVAKAWLAKRTELLAVRPDAKDRLDSYEVSLALSLGSPSMTEAGYQLYALMGRLPAGLRTEWVGQLLYVEGETALETLSNLGLVFDAGDRSRMLAPVREHAADQALAAPILRRIVEHWLALAKSAGPMVGEPGSSDAIAVLAAELANLENVFGIGIAHAYESAIDAALALTKLVWMTGIGSNQMLLSSEAVARDRGDELRLSSIRECLGDIALARGDELEARRWYDEAITLYRKLDKPLGKAHCIKGLGDLALGRSDVRLAFSCYNQSLEVYRAANDGNGEARCIKGLGDVAMSENNYMLATEHFRRAIALYEQTGFSRGRASCIKRLGDIALRSSMMSEAKQRYREASEIFREVSAILGQANCERRLGKIAKQDNENDLSISHFEIALSLYEKIGHRLAVADCRRSLGDLSTNQLRWNEASNHYDVALGLYRQLSCILGEAGCVNGLGDVALALGQEDLARVKFDEALALYRRVEEPYWVGWGIVRLARRAEGSVRAERVAEARAVWESIGRADLIADLEREFGAGREG